MNALFNAYYLAFFIKNPKYERINLIYFKILKIVYHLKHIYNFKRSMKCNITLKEITIFNYQFKSSNFGA